MIYPYFFSVLFFSVCIVSMISAILVIKDNHKASVNRCFFALNLSVNIWSVGLALANIAPNAEVCEIWRRVSAVGWGTAYAIILHFALIIAGKNTLLKRKWHYFCLYFPAAITVFAFAIPSSINPSPFHLIRTDYGWTNLSSITSYNIWDWVFLIYYMTYSIISLALFFQWGRKATEHKTKMQSRALFISFTVAFILASLTDKIMGNEFAKLPQMAPIVFLIPIITIYYIIKKYNLIIAKPVGKKDNYLRILFVVILYIILVFGQANISVDGSVLIFNSIEGATVRGIITQLQMFLSIYLVLKEDTPGYIASLLLNIGSIISSSIHIIRFSSIAPLPGVISYVGVLMLVVLIGAYKRKMLFSIEKIDTQKKSLEASEKKLYHMAYYDSLTGLHNKDWFIEYLDKSIHTAKRNAFLIGVMFADLDSFKTINDTMGHSAGDALLKEVASRLSACLREEDAIARFGGDEFLIMFNNINDVEHLNRITKRIMDVFKKSILIKDIKYYITASVGVAVYPADGDNSEALIKNADIAMYLAKRSGKNQYIFSSTDIKNETIKTMKLTNKLYRVLEKEELYIHYQPQVKAESQEIIGFEALLRWNNEEYGFIPPNVFIPMAEHTGLIRPIGLWVFRSACEQLKIFQQKFGNNISMSINLSIEQLKDIDIADKICKIIKETGVDANKLQVEITESIAFNEDPLVLQKIEDIKNIGLSIAIDDFGTGFSSFTRLKTFPIDLIKIDIDFVRGISSGSHKDMAIIKSIIQISKNLKIEVLAEGVETEEQFEYLRRNGCNFIQGYYFYKPMKSSDIELLTVPSAIAKRGS